MGGESGRSGEERGGGVVLDSRGGRWMGVRAKIGGFEWRGKE